jgi:alginate O-acetyltransferase complex protein AlgI
LTFNSLVFLVFLASVLLLHSLPFPWRVRKLNLLLASYLFYSAWNPPFVILLWISTLVDWLAARHIARAERPALRRGLLLFSLSVNLGLLGAFKYGEFLVENFSALLRLLGVDFQPVAPDIILPMGISFYTFQSLSYTLDVYRNRTRPWGSFLDFALYVSFFPQLVSGPIVRAPDFLPQCSQPRRASSRQLGWGLSLLVIGLTEKIVLADALLAPVADKVYRAPEAAGFVSSWIGTLAFSGQIFFDFSGYSSCAIGVAMCLGFALPDNFHFPYAAIGFSDFWRRWHISLSTWLRDYVYISMGGNRRGVAREHLNVMWTMLVGGLWHGAAWHFVAWGGLHGLYLSVERLLRSRGGSWQLANRVGSQLLLALLTYLLVCITWVLFRAQDFTAAAHILGAMFGAGYQGSLLSHAECLRVLLVSVCLFSAHWWLRDSSLESLAERIPWGWRSLLLAAMLIALLLTPGENRAFIYFQF